MTAAAAAAEAISAIRDSESSCDFVLSALRLEQLGDGWQVIERERDQTAHRHACVRAALAKRPEPNTA